MKNRIVILSTLLAIFCANQVFAQCSVSITPNPPSVCAGNSITLTANATGTAPITYSWSSGGSGSTTSVTPAITTTYSVTITDAAGCTATASVSVTVNPKPTASFTFTNNNGCAGTANSFTSTGTGGQAPYTYSWNFGGAGTSAQANPSFTFNPASGTGTQTYNVSLTVTDARGCTATTSQNVTIRRKPDATIEDQDIFEPWTFCDAGGGSILTINNSSTTQADNTNYTINWGDGSTPYNGATLPNGTAHTYTGQGYFNIVLTVTGSNGCTATTTYPVFSGGNPEIGLANPGGTTGICTDKQITFPITNFGNNPPGTTYTITVNDGSAPVVYQHPPPSSYIHNFTTSSCGFTSLGGFTNAFHVRIVAENPCGTTAALVEPIRLGGGPVADFTFTPPPDICVGSTVNFTSTTEGTYITNQGACITTLQGGWTLTPATGWTLAAGNMSTPDPVSINFTQAGLYNMRLIVSNPCGSDTTNRPVCVAENPDANFTMPSLTGCAPLTLLITNTSNTVFSCANTVYLWTVTHNGSLCTSGGSWNFQSGNAGSQSPFITLNGSGTFTLSLTITNNCGTNTETKTITVDKIPEVVIAPLPNICAGNTINPNAVINPCYSSLTNVSWSFPGGNPASSTSQNPGAITYGNSGTFTITLSATNVCGTGNDTETFTIAPPPPVPVLSSNSPECAGQTITINANPINGVTYTWTGPLGFTSGNQNISINNATILQAGSYTLVVTDGLGCTNTASINVVVNPLPIITVNNPSPLCTGGSVQLTAGGANTYSWSPSTGLSATTGATVTANPTSTTTYTVIGTNVNGCSNTTTAIVTINPLPNISVTQPPAICAGQSTVLTASGGTSYSWSPSTGLSGTSGAIVTANPSTTTTYTVTGTSAQGCSSTATTTVTINPLPNVTVNNPPTICAGQSATLNASGANTYTWSPATGLSGTTGATVTANPNSTTTYIVTGTSGGCSNTAQVTVNVNPRPNVTVNSGTICIGSSITLNAGGANTYAWSPATALSATTGASVTANPTSTTTYTVTGTDGNGCTNTATATVTITNTPTVDAGPDQTFCNQNIPVQLTGTPNGGTWSGTGVTSGGSFNPANAGLGTHTLTYNFTNAGGCSGNNNVTITVIPLTIPNAGNDFPVCRNAGAINLNTQLNPTPTGGTWSGLGVLFGTFTPSLAFNGQSTITYTTGTGTCEASDAVVITVNPQPNITVNSPSVCAGNSVTLNANGGTTYSWSPATALSETTGASVTANPNSTTTYTVTGTDGSGCTNTATATVTVNPLPVVDAGPDQTFCEQNTTIQLTGTPNNGTWSGTGVSPTGSFNPANAGVGAHTITYNFTNGNGCSNNDITIITVVTLTVPAAGNDLILCRDVAVVDLNLQNNPTPSGGTWSGTGVFGNNFNPANANIGLNNITYSFGTGTCLASDVIIITVNPLPVVTVNSPAICIGNSMTLNANGADTYNWSPATGLNATSGASVNANPVSTTTYIVTGTDGNNCVNTATSTVTVYPLPVVDAGPAQTFCDQNIPVQLTGTPASGNWTGTGVTTTGSFNPSTAGVGQHQLTYSFTDGNFCSNNDVTTMTVIVPTIANAGNDFPLCRDAAPVDLNAQNNPTPIGGTWTGSGVATDFFTAANATIGQNTIVYSIGTGTCLSQDTIAITVNPLPTITVNSPTICESGSTILNASGAVNYSWNPTATLSDSVGASVTANPITTTTYTVRGVDGNSCVNTNVAIVSVNPLPIVDAGPAQTFCDQNIPVQLTGTPASGNWTGTGVSTTGSFNPSTAGVGSHQLIYSFTDGNSCTNNDVTTMTVIVPTIANAGNDFPVCVDASPFDLNVQNNPTPLGGTWTGNGVANNFFTAANATVGQNAIVYSIGVGTCLSQDTIAITVNPLPTIIVNSPTICESGSAILNASGAINYSWNPTATLSDSIGASVTANPITTTIYTVRGVDGNSCVNTNVAIVSVNPLPIVDAGPDQSFCNTNTPVTFTGNPVNGIWNGIGITSGGIFNPAQAGVGAWQLIYSLTDGNNCANQDTTVATVVDPQLANAGADVAICVTGTSVDLATIGATPTGGTWSGTGVTANFFYPFAAGIGQHTLTYSFGTGTCQTLDNTSATVNPQPALSVNSPEICFEDTALLTVFGADNYAWSPMNELSIIGGSVAEAFPSATTAYLIVGTIAATGCSDTIVSTVTVHPLPVVYAGDDTSTCNQPQYPTQLQANPPGGIWAGNFISQSGLFTPSGSAADTGSYAVTYSFTDGNSCSNADNALVLVIAPLPAIAGPDKTFCIDDMPAPLTGFTPASGGVWSGNGIVNSATGLFNPSLAGVGNSKLFYDYGTGTCATRDSVTLTINPLPTPDFTFNTTCINDTTSFTDLSVANAGTINAWQWNFGNGNTSSVQNPSHVFSPAGNHTVIFEVTSSVGCNSDTTFTLTVHPLPTVAFTHDSMICPDSALQIILTTVDALNYNWDFGDGSTGTGINPSHSYPNEGTYQIKLVAETQFGCVDSASSSVLVPYPPNAFFTFNPKEGCAPLDVSFYPILPPDWTGLRYMWIFGNGDTTFSPIPPDFIRYNAAADGSDTSYIVEFYVFSHTCQNFGKFIDTVKVLNTPPAVVTANFTIGCGQTNVLFTNTNNTVFDSLYIDYGDGTGEIIPTADANFIHAFINTTNSDVTYTVTYYATGANCNSIPGTIPVTVYPNTVKAGITAAPQDVCKGEQIVLTSNASGGSYFYYDLGTGIISPVSNAAQSITLELADTGSYVIYQLVYSADSCSVGKDSVTVHIHPAPVSDFDFSQPSSGCDRSEVTFTNISYGYGSSVWDFGDNTTVIGDSPNHIFETQGKYNITLITENAAGCKDTLSKPVTIDFLEKGLYVPNAFSPEFGDPKVREFKPAGQCMETYHLHIYNTWGELLWETYKLTPEGEPEEGWNGRHMKTGVLLPQDVYVWKIEAVFINSSVWAGKDYEDGRTKKIGSVTLLR